MTEFDRGVSIFIFFLCIKLGLIRIVSKGVYGAVQEKTGLM